jgi:hypothetical protein
MTESTEKQERAATIESTEQEIASHSDREHRGIAKRSVQRKSTDDNKRA